eukprot:5637289-Amphidinium_carterae.1
MRIPCYCLANAQSKDVFGFDYYLVPCSSTWTEPGSEHGFNQFRVSLTQQPSGGDSSKVLMN